MSITRPTGWLLPRSRMSACGRRAGAFVQICISAKFGNTCQFCLPMSHRPAWTGWNPRCPQEKTQKSAGLSTEQNMRAWRGSSWCLWWSFLYSRGNTLSSVSWGALKSKRWLIKIKKLNLASIWALELTMVQLNLKSAPKVWRLGNEGQVHSFLGYKTLLLGNKS